MHSYPSYTADGAPENTAPHLDSLAILDYLLGNSFAPLFCVYLFLVVVLPSGSIHGINGKLPLYAWLLPSALYTFYRNGTATLLETCLLLGLPAVLLLWVIEAQAYGFEISGSLRQYTDILLTLLTCWLAVLFCRRSGIAHVQLLRIVVMAETAASFLKCSLLLYAFFRGIPITSLVEGIDQVFGVELMTMDLGSLFGRIQFVSDGLIPICVFAVLCYHRQLRLGAWSSSVVMSLLISSVILSFSRYFWAYTLLALAMGLIVGKKDKVYALLSSLLVAITLFSFPLLSSLYETRFSEAVAGDSDSARVEQVRALKAFFLDAPLLGHGLGSYTPQVIRSNTESKYGYEVQLLALLGQVGLTGILLFTAILLFYFRSLWPRHRNEWLTKGFLMLLLLAWLASGLFNPLLINPVGAVSYAALMCMARMTPSPMQPPRDSLVVSCSSIRPSAPEGGFSG